MRLVCTWETRAFHAGRGERPKRPLEITVSCRFRDRHPKTRVHGIGSIHAQMVFGEGSVGRLDDCQHCKVINVDVAEDWLAWVRRGSRRLFTVRAPQDRSCRRCAFCRAATAFMSVRDRCGLAERISQITDEPRFEGADRQ